jgi:hypothetical protein
MKRCDGFILQQRGRTSAAVSYCNRE